MSFTQERLTLEEEAKREIIKTLERFTYRIKRNDIPETFSLSKVKDEDKPKMAKYLGDKFDLFVTKVETNENYLVETKGKSRQAHLTWVNKVDYDGYYDIASIGYPIIMLIWVKENRKIYSHEITNPKDFEEGTDQDGKPIYFITKSLIHEIQPSEDIPLRLWVIE